MNNSNFISNISLNQFFKFGLLGVTINIFGYLFFLVLTIFLKLSPYLVISFLYPLSILISYKLNKDLTFKQDNSNFNIYQIAKFIIIYVSVYFLNLVFLYIGINTFNFSPSFIQALAVIVLGIYLFLMQKKYVYV